MPPLKETPKRKPRADLTGKRFGRLEVLSRHSVARESKWLCRCDCGKEIVIGQNGLVSGKNISCGCLQMEVRKDNFAKHIHFVEGTCIERIAAKTTCKNNTTGFRGVSMRPNGTYRVHLTFKGKRHYLGDYKTLDEAIKARLVGEEMVDEFVEEYRRKQA